MEFIRTLGESPLISSQKALDRRDIGDIAEIAYYSILALRILLLEDETHEWAVGYARKTAEWGNFDKWRGSGNDLYVLLHGLSPHDHPEKTERTYPVDLKALHRWLKDAGRDAASEARTTRLFMKLDFEFRMKKSTAKALRRRVMDWDDATPRQQVSSLNQIISFFKNHAPRAELLKHLKELKKDEEEPLSESAPAPEKSFLAYLQRKKP